MARRARRAAAGGLALLLGVGLCTYVAGEQTEVVVVRSFDADGVPHDTKVWTVDLAGDVWVRVANPRRDAVPVRLRPDAP
jgi:hypothetical protein